MIEVLIAGAGPAGSVAALVLARAGSRVLLVDRARFPRDTLCGDLVNPGAMAVLRRLGLAARVEARGLPIDGMIVTGEGGLRVAGAYPGGVRARALVRRDLDAGLLSAAVEAGARFEEGVEVLEPLVYEGARGPEVRGAIVRARDGRQMRIPALLTLAADGRDSALAFGLGLSRHPERPRRWAAGAHFEGVEGCSAHAELHLRARRCIGVAPVPDGLVSACVVTGDRRGLEDPTGLVHRVLAADPLLAGRFARAHAVAPAIALGPLAVDASAAGMAGLLLAGDAAGFIDPMTGDGIGFAIRGAELAARIGLWGLEHGPATVHVRLAAERRMMFARKQRFNRALRALVASPASVRGAALGARLAPFLLRRAIAIAGDVAS